MRKIEPELIIDGWNVYDDYYRFYACNNGKTLTFKAEYKHGLYFNILSYYDGKRAYTSPRYHYKLIPLVQKITYELLKKGCLWDNKNDCEALETYKKDIEPYYRKCKENGMPLYEDAEFLDGLFE